MLRKPTLCAAVLLLLAGCGLNGEEQSAADSLRATLTQQRPTEAEADTAECVAETWVGETGIDTLVAEGLLNRDLEARKTAVQQMQRGLRTVSEAVARGFAVASVSCADYDLIAAERRDQFPDASDQDIDAYADCLKGISDDDQEQAIVDQVTGQRGSRAITSVSEAAAGCADRLAR